MHKYVLQNSIKKSKNECCISYNMLSILAIWRLLLPADLLGEQAEGGDCDLVQGGEADGGGPVAPGHAAH
jgi:hypothetical protein